MTDEQKLKMLRARQKKGRRVRASCEACGRECVVRANDPHPTCPDCGYDPDADAGRSAIARDGEVFADHADDDGETADPYHGRPFGDADDE